MRVGPDPQLLDIDTPTYVYVDSGATISYAYGRSTPTVGTIAVGASLLLSRPVWVTAPSDTYIHLEDIMTVTIPDSVVSSAAGKVDGGNGINAIVTLTAAAYAALTPKVSTTLYVIVG